MDGSRNIQRSSCRDGWCYAIVFKLRKANVGLALYSWIRSGRYARVIEKKEIVVDCKRSALIIKGYLYPIQVNACQVVVATTNEIGELFGTEQ